MRSIFCLLFLYYSSLPVQAQDIYSFQTYYSNDFREWILEDSAEQQIGTLRASWQFEKDYSQWDIRIGELSGSIYHKWRDQNDDWEIHLQNDFYTAQPVWKGQFDSWRITNNNKTYYVNLIRDPDGFQWKLSKEQEDLCFLYNTYYYDLREWTIEYFGKVNDPALMVTVVFLVSYYSTPK